MSLYDIDNKLMMLVEEAVDVETGEIYESQEDLDKAIDACEMELDNKIENIGCFIKNLNAEVEALANEKKNIEQRKKRAEKKIEYLTNYLNGYLESVYPNFADRKKWKFSTGKVLMKYRKSTQVDVPDVSALEDEYIKTEIKTSADKKAIKDAIKEGKDVKGAKLVDNLNLSIG